MRKISIGQIIWSIILVTKVYLLLKQKYISVFFFAIFLRFLKNLFNWLSLKRYSIFGMNIQSNFPILFISFKLQLIISNFLTLLLYLIKSLLISVGKILNFFDKWYSRCAFPDPIDKHLPCNFFIRSINIFFYFFIIIIINNLY